MSDSDWMVGGLVVIGEQGALIGDPELPVEPDDRGQGQQPLTDADIVPAQGAARVLFQAELVLEGVEGALNPLAHAAKRPEPARLVLTVGADQPRAQLAEVVVEVAAGEPLSAKMIVPSARARWRAASSSSASATSRSPSLWWPDTS